jgi:hypothetical protein
MKTPKRNTRPKARLDQAYIMVRCTAELRARYEALAKRHGYDQLSPFVRKALNDLLQAA